DLGAELGVDGAELEADVAAAYHHHALGQLVERQRAGRVDDRVAVEIEAGDDDRPRAGGEDDALGDDAGGVAAVFDDHDVAVAVAALEARRADGELGAVGLEELLDAAGELADDAALPLLHLLHVDRRRALDGDAHVGRLAELV